ncbi:hypothetical protein L202_08011 [Cryptococcus amylolentus CBS 6039]|uniref:Uncharacterized protein n=1 Tax=Cryptococcus amylolentus CBS 6039 TaxID=1295533 RepID=A0A1E3HAZ4_9TREE|nr:hypothetical protein L202_08011 [Cryptococcus amylolentus CBS 6039]ODN73509.1 hypothetical protein L202_08011 [Cryptococcus amylolentus CBS 6039]
MPVPYTASSPDLPEPLLATLSHLLSDSPPPIPVDPPEILTRDSLATYLEAMDRAHETVQRQLSAIDRLRQDIRSCVEKHTQDPGPSTSGGGQGGQGEVVAPPKAEQEPEVHAPRKEEEAEGGAAGGAAEVYANVHDGADLVETTAKVPKEDNHATGAADDHHGDQNTSSRSRNGSSQPLHPLADDRTQRLQETNTASRTPPQNKDIQAIHHDPKYIRVGERLADANSAWTRSVIAVQLAFEELKIATEGPAPEGSNRDAASFSELKSYSKKLSTLVRQEGEKFEETVGAACTRSDVWLFVGTTVPQVATMILNVVNNALVLRGHSPAWIQISLGVTLFLSLLAAYFALTDRDIESSKILRQVRFGLIMLTSLAVVILDWVLFKKHP